MSIANDFTKLPEYVEATRTQVRPGEVSFYSVPRLAGSSLTDVTSFMPGQQWSKDRLPPILYHIDPPPGWHDYKRESWRNGPKKNAQGVVILERWPQKGSPQPLRNFPALPDQIGSKENPLFLLAWRRLEPACTWADIIMRMKKGPGKKIHPNAIQMRVNRVLVPFSIPYTWLGTKDFSKPTKTQLEILARFSDEARENNSARGFMPGLTYPELGEEYGQRVPLPDEIVNQDERRYKRAAKAASTAASTAKTSRRISRRLLAAAPKPATILTKLREYEPPVAPPSPLDDTDDSDLDDYEPAIDGKKSQKQLQAELRKRQARVSAAKSFTPIDQRLVQYGKKRSIYEDDFEAVEPLTAEKRFAPIDKRVFKSGKKRSIYEDDTQMVEVPRQAKFTASKSFIPIDPRLIQSGTKRSIYEEGFFEAVDPPRQARVNAGKSFTAIDPRLMNSGMQRSIYEDDTEAVEPPRKAIKLSVMNKQNRSVQRLDYPMPSIGQFSRNIPNGTEFLVEDVIFYQAPYGFNNGDGVGESIPGGE